MIHIFYYLAVQLFSRLSMYKQPEDITYSVKYFRYLRDTFHSLESFDIPRHQLMSCLVRALAENLISGSGDVIQDMEEMTALTYGILIFESETGISTDGGRDAIMSFSVAAFATFSGDNPQLPPEEVIQVLREATALIPDSHDIAIDLSRCLATRYGKTKVINDFKEAIAIADSRRYSFPRRYSNAGAGKGDMGHCTPCDAPVNHIC